MRKKKWITNKAKLRKALAIPALVLGIAASPVVGQVEGGELVLAQSANPPSLDAMTSSSETARNINMNIYEPLVAIDENVNPIPMLAKSIEPSEDLLTYVFPLRQGVLFHNGKEMTAEDVKASLERYREVGATRGMLDKVKEIEITGDYEVTFHMSEATPTFIEGFSSPRAPAVIIPAEEAAKPANEIEIIGTGPFKFVEFVPDDHVTLEKFADYVPNEDFDGPTGFGGKKTAYLDSAVYRIIPEAGARIAALEAGEVQWADQIPVPAAKRMSADENLNVYEARQWAFMTFIMNWNLPPTDDVNFRRAVLYAIEPEEVMAIATEGFYDLNHGWQYPGRTYNAGDIGKEIYESAHIDKAKEFLAMSDYDGEEFLILTDPNYAEHSRAAVVLAEQLKPIGINAVVKQLDWATVLKIRLTDEGWNGWTLMQGLEPFLGPYGIAAKMRGDQTHMRGTADVFEESYNRLITGKTVEDRQKAFAEIQTAIYDLVPQIKIGDVGRMQAGSARLKGFKPFRAPRLNDIWLED
ncbi:ABC transporter substrate-binding protein [Primorskyibacter flagellatus]|uniref:Peptide/nickel transport system substrate-binding protein n=1 Tax=Primorskyibacter flagellatus TaxID=1387277 RepID=A0A1W1YUH5_9RHOB|nr:ABC transporter substrate-binding protein [Primorskyibacter flagellatus]SMC39855.1 peptide/nickel transport system substrate-binding protein [Primorskyibacter flagellatus]